MTLSKVWNEISQRHIHVYVWAEETTVTKALSQDTSRNIQQQ